MNDGNLYQAPAAVPPPLYPPPVAAHKPASIQVFGILHLLAAGYGLVTGIWALVMLVAGNPFLKMVPEGPGRDMQEKMMKAIEPMTFVNLGITAIVMVLVAIAGVKLLRSAKNAVKFSNIYAVTSLVAKIVAGVMVMVYMIPAQRQMMQEQLGGAGVPGSAKVIVEGAMAGGAIMGILFSCIYPVLALILLNRKPVKTWLEQFGK